MYYLSEIMAKSQHLQGQQFIYGTNRACQSVEDRYKSSLAILTGVIS